MSGERPILLLDVDGVLNVYGVDECPAGFAEFELFPEDEEPVRLCLAHGEWIRQLGERFEVVWASGWGAHAPRLLGPILGVDDFSFVPMPEIPFDPAEKVPAIAAVVGDRPAAWLDDIVTPEARAWARDRAVPTLLVEVDYRTGLERHHVDEVISWCDRLDA